MTSYTNTEYAQDLAAIVKEHQCIVAANEVLAHTDGGFNHIALPDDFSLHDLEESNTHRRRARGTYQTGQIADFFRYTKKHQEEAPSVFIDAPNMSAQAVLNFGNSDKPGHADNVAQLNLQPTTVYSALLKIDGTDKSQAHLAEWIEDWAQVAKMQFFDGDEEINTKQAVSAIRSITIERLAKMESEEQQLSATRSAFESAAASSKHKLPTLIYVYCKPYEELEERTYALRLSVLTGDGKPKLRLRIAGLEAHTQSCADELARVISGHVFGKDLSIYSGTYQRGK